MIFVVRCCAASLLATMAGVAVTTVTGSGLAGLLTGVAVWTMAVAR